MNRGISIVVFCFVLVATFLLPGSLMAQEDELTTLLSRIALKEKRTIQFEEHKFAFYLEEPISLSGKLFYSPAGILEKYIEQPEKRVLRIVGNSVISIDEEGRTTELDLRQYPAMLQLSTTMLSLLGGDHRRLTRDYSVQLRNRASEWSLTLSPRLEELQQWLREIKVEGSGNNISTITTTEVSGDYSLLRFLRSDDD